MNINAIPKLSKIVGYSPKNGKINNWMAMAKIRPLPTSIQLSIKHLNFIKMVPLLLISFYQIYLLVYLFHKPQPSLHLDVFY